MAAPQITLLKKVPNNDTHSRQRTHRTTPVERGPGRRHGRRRLRARRRRRRDRHRGIRVRLRRVGIRLGRLGVRNRGPVVVRPLGVGIRIRLGGVAVDVRVRFGGRRVGGVVRVRCCLVRSGRRRRVVRGRADIRGQGKGPREVAGAAINDTVLLAGGLTRVGRGLPAEGGVDADGGLADEVIAASAGLSHVAVASNDYVRPQRITGTVRSVGLATVVSPVGIVRDLGAGKGCRGHGKDGGVLHDRRRILG